MLREQLKVACENYEQTELRSSQEIRDLEEKLQRHTEENKVNLPQMPGSHAVSVSACLPQSGATQGVLAQ